MQVGIINHDFRLMSRFVSEMKQDRVRVTEERQQELICNLLNGATFSDLE